MKRVIAALLLVASVAVWQVEAQKYACVNTDYVMRNIPDFAEAQKRLDKYVADWQQELATREAEIATMRAEYEQESYLLPDNLKRRRQEELAAKEAELRELQQKYFGADGELDKRRAELLKPIQDRVFSTIERIAHEKNFAMVFDKAASATVLFASKKYDISDDVLELLGYSPKAKQRQESSTENRDSQPSKRVTNPELRPPQGPTRGGRVQGPLGAPNNGR